MSFCTQCGMRVIEGEAHACQQAAAGAENQTWNGAGGAAGAPHRSNQGGGFQSVAQLSKQIDTSVIVSLLKNPQQALKLQPAKDFIYGVLGVAASLLGFLIWAWIFGQKMESLLGDLFGGLFGGFSDFDDLGDYSDGSSIGAAITGKLIVLGIISIIALFGSLWVVGNWKGERKHAFKDAITYLGAAQYTFGAGFVLAGVCSFINLRIAFIVLSVNLLTVLVTTVMHAVALWQVREDRRLTVVGLSVGLYLVLVALLSAIVM
ncbi:hypothetical protein PaecuDRAFT_2089 [Paenibacillus curdlanolyticus YK9]|uniref:Yip1 domain-containing protein n=1 Tax=Paenibacillus curdlanolyticus YK9 TaxID=717606 RepID=E0I8V8_9BACL|nr:hypothetical protein [Paenibacillus curdlanolyticus]EFM10842.1 hypothetical protein PaecuDRAFT_2089 [Paenibacillus curdlanolyticus YK9]